MIFPVNNQIAESTPFKGFSVDNEITKKHLQIRKLTEIYEFINKILKIRSNSNKGHDIKQENIKKHKLLTIFIYCFYFCDQVKIQAKI